MLDQSGVFCLGNSAVYKQQIRYGVFPKILLFSCKSQPASLAARSSYYE